MTSAVEIRARLGALVEREGGAPDGWAEQLQGFLELLGSWNRVVNLISRKTESEALERHLLPCLAALSVVPPGQSLRVLDVGSGGGFPGVPLRILRPRVRLDLVDATRKKVHFLERCVEELGLEDTRTHWCRIERPAPELLARAPFDRILARAVGDDANLRESGRPILALEGQIWVFALPGAQGAQAWSDENGHPVTALRRLL